MADGNIKLRSLAEDIKRTVSVDEIARTYGINLDTSNRTECFCCGSPGGLAYYNSGEKNESAFYCFSCEQRGDVIDVVAIMEDLPKYKAIEFLAARFNVVVNDGPAAWAERLKWGYENRVWCDSSGPVDVPGVLVADQRVIDKWKSLRRQNPEQLERYADGLQVDPDILQSIGFRWDSQNQCGAFPMYNHNKEVVGIRYRSFDGSMKWSEKFSCNGLFFDTSCDFGNRVFLPEGPTDTIALLSMGVQVVGRPNSNVGGATISRMLSGRDLVVVSDRDEIGRNGKRAGLVGASKCAKAVEFRSLSVAVIISPPGYKDVREWVDSGAGNLTRLNELVKNALYLKKPPIGHLARAAEVTRLFEKFEANRSNRRFEKNI